MMNRNIKIISAGAGSGKTTRLTKEIVNLLSPGNPESIQPEELIVTTFTVKAADELKDRVRTSLLQAGLVDEANRINGALIGTVNSVCGKLLQKYAFEAGLSPEQEILDDKLSTVIFSESLSDVVNLDDLAEIERLRYKLSINSTWNNTVENIVNSVRSNNLSIADLDTSKEKSAELLKAYLPGDLYADLKAFENTLLKEAEKALKEMQTIVRKGAKYTEKAKQVSTFINNLLYELRAGHSYSWHSLLQLYQADPGKDFGDAVQDLKQLLQNVHRHFHLREEVIQYLSLAFDTARKALGAYQNYKKERGLIDFQDQEFYILKLLKEETISERLQDEYKVLLVDEFQDTSPIQLKIFLRLSNVVSKNIWVGDPKQAIYGFRGTDPKLMQALIEKIGIQDRKKDILDTNYRSQKELIWFNNAVFTKAFNFPADQVALKFPSDKEVKKQEPAIRIWNQDKYNFQKQHLVNCIIDLLGKKERIHPKNSKTSRPIRPGDIAILCRSNYQVKDVANALKHAGFKVSAAGTGLSSTVEWTLLNAFLHILVNPYDQLALSEILLLTQYNSNPEELLNDRMDFLSQNVSLENWGEENAFIKKIKDVRDELLNLPVPVLLTQMILELDLYRLLHSWGNEEERLENLQQILAFAIEYQKHCESLTKGCTLAGFIIYLSSLAGNEADIKGSVDGEDSVKVYTYHKAKGLEWPVVITCGLHQEPEADPFGIKVIDENEAVNLDDPLKNRWIRFWPWPFGYNLFNRKQRVCKAILADLMPGEETEDYRNKLEEEKRVLYVGFTRARDILILPLTKMNSKWISDCTGVSFQGIEIEENKSISTGLSWNKENIYFTGTNVSYNKEQEILIYSAESDAQFLKKEEIAIPELPDKYIFPSLEASVEGFESKLITRLTENRLTITPGDNLKEHENEFGNCFHAILCAFRQEQDSNLRMIREQLIAFGYEHNLIAEEIESEGSQFFQHIQRDFNPIKLYREWKISLWQDGQVLTGNVDLLVETKDCLYIFDHKSFRGGQEQCLEKAKSFGTQLTLYKEMAEKGFRKPVKGLFVHFPVEGLVVEVTGLQTK